MAMNGPHHVDRTKWIREREFFIDNLLVRIHLIIVMIRWTGLAPWEFEFPFSGSLTSTFLVDHSQFKRSWWNLLPQRNEKRFRGGLVLQAHRWLYHSTLGLRVIKKKKLWVLNRLRM